MIYVQYGSGPLCAPKEWQNYDASLALRWERLPLLGRSYTKNARRFPENTLCGDIVEGLAVSDSSCAGVFASHVLEHLTLADFHRALANTRRMLADDGIFRLIVPDLEAAARAYVAGLDSSDAAASSTFLEATGLGERERRTGLSGVMLRCFNTSSHRWMWDEISLTQALKKHGFSSVRRCRFNDCVDTTFALVESEGRFERAVAMEARK